MKLALVNLDEKSGDPPLGLAYIASYVRKYGDYNDIIIADKENLLKRVLSEKPDIVGISTTSEDFSKARDLAGKIKERLEIPAVIGGPHITLLPSNLKKSNFDVGVMGEGEQTMLELMQSYEKHGELNKKRLGKIDGLVFQNSSKIKITKKRELIRPIDKIPFPARDLLNMDFYSTPRKTTFGRRLGVYGTIMSSRGCCYDCVFCASHAFWKSYRSHSPEYVIEEIKEMVKKYKVDAIMFWDDLFMLDKRRLKKIVELVEKEGLNRKLHFTFETRANLVTDEVCTLLKRMNTSSLLFGLESGSDKILGYLKNSAVTVEENKRALKLSKKYGFSTFGNFIIGTPGETKEDLKKTIELMKDENLDLCKGWVLKPYPGTKVWELYKRKGYIKEDEVNWAEFRQNAIKFYRNEEMSKEEFNKYAKIVRETYIEKQRQNGLKLELRYLKYTRFFLKPGFIKKFTRSGYMKYMFQVFTGKFLKGYMHKSYKVDESK